MRLRPLTIELQKYHMQRRWPQFNVITNRGNQAWWTGTLQPDVLGDTYTVELAYTIPKRPDIRVVSPELRMHPDHSRLPHTFPDGTLCVHLASEWRADSIIAQTVVPWTCAWLYFYQVWFRTGYWLGEGTHPDFPQHNANPRIELPGQSEYSADGPG